MGQYRLFFVGMRQRIVATEVAECLDDDEAAQKGRQLLAERPFAQAVEVWYGRRLVATLTNSYSSK
jgi:hypothetical protein